MKQDGYSVLQHPRQAARTKAVHGARPSFSLPVHNIATQRPRFELNPSGFRRVQGAESCPVQMVITRLHLSAIVTSNAPAVLYLLLQVKSERHG